MIDPASLSSEIEKALKTGIIYHSDIYYNGILNGLSIEDTGDLEISFKSKITNEWISQYHEYTEESTEIVDFSDNHYQCLFDCISERVVSFYGVTQPTQKNRDKSRQAGFISKFSNSYEGRDRGHFLSHCQGGGMDVNFFPQKKEINRGWSDAGKIFRKMERYCSSNPGVFCFSRPIYKKDSTSWVPNKLEYGIIFRKSYLIAVFPN